MVSNQINVAVLMGGVSSERGVSLRSGNEVSKALHEAGYNVIEIVVNDTELNELDSYNIDVAFIALHGAFGEDGGVQELLESKGIPYTGPGVDASRFAMNKLVSKEIFVSNNLPTPDYIDVSKYVSKEELENAVESIGMPVIVKPAMDGSSIGIKIANNMKELHDGICFARKYGDPVLVEKYIDGHEFTVSILLDKPLPIVEIKTGCCFYSYCSKYKSHKTKYSTKVNITKQVYKSIQDLALKAHSALGCTDMSRVDIILGNDGISYLLEVNTIPGFTERSLYPMAAEAENIKFEQLCDILVTNAINRKDKMLVCSK